MPFLQLATKICRAFFSRGARDRSWLSTVPGSEYPRREKTAEEIIRIPVSVMRPPCLAAIFAAISLPVIAQETERRVWKVDDVERHGLVFIPAGAKASPTPVVFVFHGHGGSSQNALNSFAMNKAWPEAISVYPQGLNTPGKLTDPQGKKAGWQVGAGDQGNRDLKLFDTMLESLKKDYKIDEMRIYSTGHSNGGGFTYLLWAERGDLFAAMGPSTAAGWRASDKLRPKPLFHIASKNDQLVKYEWQKSMIDKVIKLNSTGDPIAMNDDKHCTLYPSKDGHDVVVYLDEGGHKFAGKDAVTAMVKFFKDHPKK